MRDFAVIQKHPAVVLVELAWRTSTSGSRQKIGLNFGGFSCKVMGDEIHLKMPTCNERQIGEALYALELEDYLAVEDGDGWIVKKVEPGWLTRPHKVELEEEPILDEKPGLIEPGSINLALIGCFFVLGAICAFMLMQWAGWSR